MVLLLSQIVIGNSVLCKLWRAGGACASWSVSRERAEGSLRRDRWASLRLPSCTSALARAAADSFPEASRRGTRRQGTSNHDTQVLPHN